MLDILRFYTGLSVPTRAQYRGAIATKCCRLAASPGRIWEWCGAAWEPCRERRDGEFLDGGRGSCGSWVDRGRVGRVLQAASRSRFGCGWRRICCIVAANGSKRSFWRWRRPVANRGAWSGQTANSKMRSRWPAIVSPGSSARSSASRSLLRRPTRTPWRIRMPNCRRARQLRSSISTERQWTTDGRAVFNLSPTETIRRYSHELELVE